MADKAGKVAEAMDRFAELMKDLAEDLRDDNDDAHVAVGQAAVRQERRGDGPGQETMVQISAGDLWRLVNRSRKMIRFARQGRIPSIDQRAPLNRVIKRIKHAGLARKPYNLTDLDLR